jgi:general secretion pathway protein A
VRLLSNSRPISAAAADRAHRQPELRDKLNDRGLRQLRPAHVATTCRRSTLTRPATCATGCTSPAPTAAELQLLGLLLDPRYSKGVPRLINAVCDKTLLCGYVESTDQLGARHVRRAIRELEGKVS